MGSKRVVSIDVTTSGMSTFLESRGGSSIDSSGGGNGTATLDLTQLQRRRLLCSLETTRLSASFSHHALAAHATPSQGRQKRVEGTSCVAALVRYLRARAVDGGRTQIRASPGARLNR